MGVTEYLTVKDVACLCPSAKGGKVTRTTVHNWMKKGVHGVKLKSLLIGNSRVTTREYFQEFLDALNGRTSGCTDQGSDTGS